MAYIYVLKDPVTEKIRYVGKTICIEARLSSHLSESKRGTKNHRYDWIRSLIPLIPKIEVIEECVDTEWEERERFWIKKLLNEGHNLCNGTKGGVNVGIEPKPIMIYNTKGEYIMEVSSISEASILTKIHPGIISKQAHLKRGCNRKSEFLFRFSNDEIENTHRRSRKGAILQFSKNEKFIKEWSCIKEIVESHPEMYGYCISACCRGQIKTYRKFIFKYKN